MLSIAGLVALGPAAYAAQGTQTTVLLNGSQATDGAIVSPGDTFTLNVQYFPEVDHTEPARFAVDGPVSLVESVLEVPEGNTEIDRIEYIDGELLIYFTDPTTWGDVSQGLYALNFTIDEVEATLPGESISWEVPGGSGSVDITVRVSGDEEANVNNWLNKNASGGIYEEYVSIDPETDTVQLADNITDYAFNYTLNINTDGDTTRDDFTIADTISEYLTYNEDSFSASLTEWDENGWNKTSGDFEFEPTFEGNGFSSTVNLPSPSQLTINYSASLNPEMLDQLQDALQTSYEALEGGYGSFGFDLDNTVTFGGDEERTGTVEVGLLIREPAPDPGPGINDAFSKSVDPSNVNIELGDDNDLIAPVDLTYTITANLEQWTGTAPGDQTNDDDFTLDRNVVVRDELGSNIVWNTEADDFITIDGMEMEEVADFTGNQEDFAADEYVGKYAFVDDVFYANIGQDSSTNVTFTLKAQVQTLEGLRINWTNPQGWDQYKVQNIARYYYHDGDPGQNTVETELWDRGDTSGGINDPNSFSKEALNSDDINYVDQGESATIEYEFIVSGVDLTKSYIVDERDPNVFNFNDADTLAAIQNNITGQHAWWRNMGSEHFDVSVDDDGNLIIQLSDAGAEFVEEVDGGANERLSINVPLTTVPLDGRQSVTVDNHAVLYGEDEDEPLYWSETSSEASSYGDQAETRKFIRDTDRETGTGEWTQNLRVEVGEDGELIQDEYIYNLRFIPHGNYENVTIIPEVDELPAEVKFLGFVTDDNVDTGDNPVQDRIEIGGNLEAVYDSDAHTVTVQNIEGQLLKKEPNIGANLLVQVIDFQEDTPVVNLFGRSSAEFTPSDGYPISIAKIDSEDDEAVINDPESRFNVYDDENNLVIEDAFVENGFLRVTNAEGETTGLVVRETGVYWVEETRAPEGYELSTDRIRVVVDEDGSSQQVTFPNVPSEEPEEPPVPSIDVIKNDEGDDVHEVSAGEHDVTVTITNNGEDALENFGFEDTTNEGHDVVWDEEDLAGLEDLVLETGESYTVTGVVQVDAGQTHNDEVVVNATGVISGEPVEDDDPTTYIAEEDTYAIGDVVWIDANNNGVQDDELPLEGVTVVLFDGEGSEVDRTETNSDGRYIFDNLAAGDYQVQFVLTDEQAAIYEFTSYTEGEDTTVDSDSGFEGFSGTITLGQDNEFLMGNDEYQDSQYADFTVEASEGIDPTWDAGVVLLPVPEEPTYAIGDYVWIDANRDGVQDEDEVPLNDVTVVLFDDQGEEVARDYTNAQGRYIFDNLEAGDYTVQFLLTDEQAERYKFTSYTKEGVDVTLDSDAGEEGRSATISLGPDNEFLTSNEDYNYGPVQASEGIDPTWDAGVVEIPVPTVEIIKGDGNVEDGSIENDANTEDDAVAYEDGETRDIVINVTNTGNEDLVKVVLTDETVSGAAIESLVWATPDGTEIAAEDVDGVLTASWDGPWAPGEVITGVATLTLPVGDELHTNIASVTAEGAFSGETVEDDDPYNATPPPPVPGLEVIKNDDGDDVHQVSAGEQDVVVTITNNGNEALENFEFDDTTESGQDVVWNEEDLAGLEDLVLEIGDSYTVNGTVEVAAGETHRDNLVVNANGVISGEPVEDDDPTTYEADPTYAIGDYVWIDANRDGIQGDPEDGEYPLNGVTVVLYDGDGEERDRTTTDKNGHYIFDNLEAGDYQVQFILTDEQAELYKFTDYTEGEDTQVDSNAGEEGRSGIITLNSDNEFLTSNEDYDPNTVEASEGIDPTWDAGVQFIVHPDIQVDKNEAGDDVHQVTAGEHDVEVTFTNEGDEALEDFEFNDTTEEGHDVVWNEEDLAGLDDLVLEPGDSYTINGTVQVDAGTTHRDNVVVNASGVISGEPVKDEDPTTYEADPTYAIGDYVWVDENRDGIQGDDEEPLDGVTVVLYDGEGEEIDRTTTDENGRYFFDNLPEGEYQVGFELTEEQQRLYNFTDPIEGDDPAQDSNADENGRSEVFTLGPDSPLTSNDDYEYYEVEASEGIDPTWDAGVQLKPYAIGDYVWIDANNDGIQDEDEDPLADVTVVLFDNEGSEIDRTTTDESGRYIFDTLDAGEYEVRFILTEEQAAIYEFTDYRVDGDTEVDSDAGYSGFSGKIVLGPDNQFLTLNEDYEYGTVLAPLGIDPTWDAGVVLIPEDGGETPPPTDGPTDPSDPSEDPSKTPGPVVDPADPADDDETPGDKEDGLSKTGANFALTFGALGLLLLLTGGALYARNRQGKDA